MDEQVAGFTVWAIIMSAKKNAPSKEEAVC